MRRVWRVWGRVRFGGAAVLENVVARTVDEEGGRGGEAPDEREQGIFPRPLIRFARARLGIGILGGVPVERGERVREGARGHFNLGQYPGLGHDLPNMLVGHLAAPVVELGRGFEHYRVHGITRRRSLLVARRAPRDDPGVDEAAAVARPQPLHAPEHPGCAPRLTWQSGEHLRRAAVNAPRGPR